MKRLSESKVRKIVEKHELWLKTGGKEGKYANFSNVDLSGMNLSERNLRSVKFYNSDLHGTNFQGANLWYASFFGSILMNTDFRNAKLYKADMHRSILTKADFRGADLTCADFDDAYVNSMIYDETTLPSLACPEKGSFIGYKKAYGIRNPDNKYIVELRIPEDAKRSNATGNKCRCSKAEVLSITQLNGNKARVTKVRSSYASNFIYQLGETVEVPDFDKCRWKECAPGIHFFMNKEDAVAW